jgi:hypothetical protein
MLVSVLVVVAKLLYSFLNASSGPGADGAAAGAGAGAKTELFASSSYQVAFVGVMDIGELLTLKARAAGDPDPRAATAAMPSPSSSKSEQELATLPELALACPSSPMAFFSARSLYIRRPSQLDAVRTSHAPPLICDYIAAAGIRPSMCKPH